MVDLRIAETERFHSYFMRSSLKPLSLGEHLELLQTQRKKGHWSLDCFGVVIRGVSDHGWTFDKTRNCIESKGIVIKWKYLCFSANPQSKWRCWNLDGKRFNLDWENMNQKWLSKNRSRDLLRSSHAQESLGPSNTSLLLPLWPLERSLNSIFGGIGKERSTP